jgi:hypothetical protein
MLPKYIKPEKRRAHSARMHAAKARKRIALGVDADTLRMRAYWDARDGVTPAKAQPEICRDMKRIFRQVRPEIEHIENMNDTPRTNEHAGNVLDSTPFHSQDFDHDKDGDYVHADFARTMERENNALRAKVESASAIITELLSRTAKTDCRECDDAVAAAMAWLHDNAP